jgi:nucleoside-diphosphate-sugar epimerase
MGMKSMTTVGFLRSRQDIILRVIADALMLNTAILTALALRLFYMVAFNHMAGGVSYDLACWDSLAAYARNSWALTLLCLTVFALSGFYTYGRAYRSRYKALIIVQAVSLGYLLFGCLAYVSGGLFSLPRTALVLAWLLSLGCLLVSRLWSQLWTRVILTERRLFEGHTERHVKRVLVIGGGGYIGSALLTKLLDADYHVRLLDLLLYSTEPIQDVLAHPNLEVIQADFRQVDKVVEAMQDVDAVIHLGAIVGDPACALDEELTIEVNLMATRMIAEVAKGSRINRFIFASTCSVYGASDELLDEYSALNPVSLYARSKIASEQVLKNLAGADFSPVILRFGTIYGLSGRTRFDLVVNLLAAKAVVEGKITVFGGDQWRPFVHVDDAALAVIKALQAPLGMVRNKVFNVGSDEQNYTIQQVGEIIQRLVPTAQMVNMGSDTDRRNYRVNFGKIHNILGFVPQWSVEQGIQQVISRIQSGQIVDYRDAKYSNVKFLSEERASRLIPRHNGWAYELINEATPGVAVASDEPVSPAGRDSSFEDMRVPFSLLSRPSERAKSVQSL